MKVLADVLKESTVEALLKVADNFLSGNPEGYKVWTNSAWDKRLVSGSNTVICVAVPDSLLLEVEKDLVESGLLNPETHKLISETKTAMVYLWDRGSYIAPHRDSNYGKAISVYLNKDWEISDGGLFCYVDSEELRCILPKYNSGVENSSGTQHFTTPVTGDRYRISLQVFINYKEELVLD